MPSPDAPVVELEQLSRHFGHRRAVQGLTLTIGAGEIVALLGPNGAGKTTTLRLLAGLIPPSSGHGTIAGLPLGHVHARGVVGLLTETPGLWDRLTVLANLTTYARLHGVGDPVQRARDVMARLGLQGREHDAAGTLSKGLRQRVALARAILHAPRLLLLDEPTSGLDPAAASDVRELMAALAREGTAVLLCTHHLAEAEGLAARIGVLRTTLLALDTPAGLRQRLAGPPGVIVEFAAEAARWRGVVAPLAADVTASGHTLTLTLRSPEVVPDVIAALAGAGARVTAVRPVTASLEAAYLALVNADA